LLPAAVALELMHCYSLVHDDLPAMDDDDLRRGQPTCHLQFDEATAVLVGDSLQALAYQALLQTPISAEGKVALVQRLSEASGPSGMVGGQMLDMLASAPDAQLLTQTELQQLHQLKTGQLIECALAMGSIVGRYYDPRARTDQSDPKAAHLLQFAQAIGLAFQVQDDILDETGSTTALGKTAGSDQRANKSTYPRLLGLSGAKELLHQLYTRAQGHLKAIQGDTQALDELATQIVERHH